MFDYGYVPKAGGEQVAGGKSTLDTIGDYMFRGGKSKSEIIAAQDLAEQKYLANAKAKGFAPTEAGIKAARADAGPGFLSRFGPTAGLAGLGLYAAGAFDAPEQERLNLPESGLDVYNRSPETYNVAGMTPNLVSGPFKIPTNYTFNYTPYQLPVVPFQRAAEGGEIFPRRNGGIGPNEGTPEKIALELC